LKALLVFEALENSIAIVNAIGGSTNAVLHLLAIAKEIGVKLVLKDFERIRKRTPHIADLRPGGLYVMLDLDKIGGIPVILNSLLKKELIHADAMTVTGCTMKKNLESTNLLLTYHRQHQIRKLLDQLITQSIKKAHLRFSVVL
jgi:dihydroxy-acid dehydratase